jgi:hypothetical protein
VKDETHGYLPSGKVIVACDALLAQIGDARGKITLDLMDNRRPAGEQFNYDRDYARLGPELKVIPEMHRQAEAERLLELKELAAAVGAIDKSLTVYISLHDFALIRRFYS